MEIVPGPDSVSQSSLASTGPSDKHYSLGPVQQGMTVEEFLRLCAEDDD